MTLGEILAARLESEEDAESIRSIAIGPTLTRAFFAHLTEPQGEWIVLNPSFNAESADLYLHTVGGYLPLFRFRGMTVWGTFDDEAEECSFHRQAKAVPKTPTKHGPSYWQTRLRKLDERAWTLQKRIHKLEIELQGVKLHSRVAQKEWSKAVEAQAKKRKR